MAKPPLNDEIQSRLRLRHLTLGALAQHLGVPEATVRTWVHRNKYPVAAALQITKYLDLPETLAEVERSYSVAGWTRPHAKRRAILAGLTLRDAFRVTDRRGRRSDGPAGFWAEIGELIDRMTDGDLYAVCSATVTPEEMDVSADARPLREKIARAAERGGRFLYLRPTNEVLRPYRENWHFKEFPDSSRIDIEFRTFLDELIHLLGRGEGARRRAASRIVQVLVADSPFWTPGFVIGMFQTQDSQRNLDRRMWCRLPGGHSGVIYRERNNVFDERFAEFVDRSLKAELAKPLPNGDGAKRETTRRHTIDEIQKVLDALFPWEPPH